MEVDVEAIGAREGAEVFHRLAHRATHARPVMERLGREVLAEDRARLDAGATKPLEASTQARKARDGEDPRPLRGALRLVGGKPTRVADTLYRALTVYRDVEDGQKFSARKDGLDIGLVHNGPAFYGRFQAEHGRSLYPEREWVAHRAADLMERHLAGEFDTAPGQLSAFD